MNSIGCGDSSCIFSLIKKKGGQHTNGGCRSFKNLEHWIPAENRWNRDEVRKVQQDTQRLASDLRRALAQIEAVRKRCTDKLVYGDDCSDLADEILQTLDEVAKL